VNSAFILQIAAIAIGGGSVQFLIFLLRRRSELHKLDAESDATLLDSATDYIGTLQTGEKALRIEIADLKAELRTLKQAWADERAAIRGEWDAERAANTEALESSNRDVSRFRLQLAQVRAELSVSQSEIEELKRRVWGPHNPNDDPKGTSR